MLPHRPGRSEPPYGSVGPPESITQTASRSVQRLWQTDHDIQSVTRGCIYIRSTAIQPKYSHYPVTSLHPMYIGSITARHSNSGREPNFAALSTRRHLYSAGRQSRWALAHILLSSVFVYIYYSQLSRFQHFWQPEFYCYHRRRRRGFADETLHKIGRLCCTNIIYFRRHLFDTWLLLNRDFNLE